jgi:hypothetical protein
MGWSHVRFHQRSRPWSSGSFVPYVVGYDSDEDDDYDLVDIQAGPAAGVIDLPPKEAGLYMTMPSGSDGDRQLVQIKNGKPLLYYCHVIMGGSEVNA